MWGKIPVKGKIPKAVSMIFLMMALVLAAGCDKEEGQASKQGDAKAVVKSGDKVKVHYTGTLADGTVFDKSQEGSPLEFTVGSGQMISGFDKAVQGMALNEVKTVTILAEEAYGQRNETLIRSFPKSAAPEDFSPEIGMVIGMQDQTGRQIPATITDITEDSLFIDLNPPLAGKDLTFEIRVVGIE